MRNPFDLNDAVIRDLHAVRVTRHAPSGGRFCEYRKVFKKGGLNDAEYWIRRENEFLLEFALKRLRHTVEFSAIARGGDGTSPPVVEWVATCDAGVTLEDWLQIRPCYGDGDTLKHPFRHTGPFLRLLRTCLAALWEIHAHGIVHCDIKEDNICLPYQPYPYRPGDSLALDFERVRLIDFAFSISRDRPLERPLPIEPKADYQSRHLKQALKQDRGKACGPFQAQQLDCRADLYSLGYLAGRIYDTGLVPPQGAEGHAVLEGIRWLVERLKAYDELDAMADPLPHGGLMADIDALLEKIPEDDAHRQFSVDGQQPVPPYPLTPPTPLAAADQQPEQAAPHEPAQGGETATGPTNLTAAVKNTVTENKLIHRLTLAAEIFWLLTALGSIGYAARVAMMYGFMDGWVCGFADPDRQIRDCRVFGLELWSGPSHYPPPALPLPQIAGDNTNTSVDKLLKIAVANSSYSIGDNLIIQFATAKPLHVRVLNLSSSNEIDPVYPPKPNGEYYSSNTFPERLEAGVVHEFPAPGLGLKLPIKGPQGRDHLVAIASERPFPPGIALLNPSGALTEQAFALSPTVVRLEYMISGEGVRKPRHGTLGLH